MRIQQRRCSKRFSHVILGCSEAEYSTLIPLRNVVARQQQDFLLNRTADGYVEVLEIKTTLKGDELMLYDKSHDSWYPRADLTKSVSQTGNYITELDAHRDKILRRDGVDSFKVIGKIIIGRDGDETQVEQLREYNSFLTRMEVLTFDQIVRIANRSIAAVDIPDLRIDPS